MSPEISRVLKALAGDDVAALASAVQDCKDIDERLADGESALFHAVLSGHIEFVEVLIASGANPNFRATEPAEDSLAPTPLELAQQARFLMDWDRYHPIAELLQAHGARDREGSTDTDTPGKLEAIEARARSWQEGRGNWGDRIANWLILIVDWLASRIPGRWNNRGPSARDTGLKAILCRARESSRRDA